MSGHTVIIASKGRPEVLADTVQSLAAQTLPPSRLILSVTVAADVSPSLVLPEYATVITGGPGLCAQLNRALRLAGEADIITVFDDDVEIAPEYLAEVRQAFAAHPEAVAFDGVVVLDGMVVVEPPVTRALARETIRTATRGEPRFGRAGVDLYGCNMNFRGAAIRAVGFDEKLALYAWQFERDAGARLLAHGRVFRQYDACRIVHLGSRAGRMKEHRLGYSQVVNPYYLWRKGTTTLGFALCFSTKLILSNAVFSILPDRRQADRKGRLWGNLLGLADIVRGRARPERIESM